MLKKKDKAYTNFHCQQYNFWVHKVSLIREEKKRLVTNPTSGWSEVEDYLCSCQYTMNIKPTFSDYGEETWDGGYGAHPNKGTCGNTAGMGISSELQANGFTSWCHAETKSSGEENTTGMGRGRAGEGSGRALEGRLRITPVFTWAKVAGFEATRVSHLTRARNVWHI